MNAAPRGPAIVTGGVSGLGRGIAVGLARAGWRTVVVGRDAERVRATVPEIATEAGGGRVEGIAVADLAVRAEMHGLAERIARDYPDVSVLVNNAGGLFSPRQTTADGLERTFALNVLAPFVLTQRVGEQMRSRGGGRIVEIASAAH
ncbi:MAG TPA: SDR family NAD(P)-dependent oxidoreductase, partial [Thermoplasmata archaeon]|nr:SDR family NAD(P)-dependent oxidoreductase [Thermoplasmata archaeon]